MKISNTALLTTLASLLLVIGGCGGGGGEGGGGAANDGSAQYSGNLNAATANSGNATALSTKAVDVTDDAMSGGATMTRTVGSSNAMDIVRNIILRQTRAHTRDFHSPAGSCGGSVTQTASGGNDTNFNGTVVFASFCDGFAGGPTVTISGSVNFSGTADAAGNNLSLTLSLVNFTVTEQPGNETTVMTGTLAFTFTGSEQDMTISMAVQESGGATYWMSNFRIDENSIGQYSISGQFYHPQHGYVTITTVAPLTKTGEWPTSGTILLTGANGSKIQVSMHSDGYRLSVDSDGANGFETIATSSTPWPTN